MRKMASPSKTPFLLQPGSVPGKLIMPLADRIRGHREQNPGKVTTSTRAALLSTPPPYNDVAVDDCRNSSYFWNSRITTVLQPSRNDVMPPAGTIPPSLSPHITDAHSFRCRFTPLTNYSLSRGHS